MHALHPDASGWRNPKWNNCTLYNIQRINYLKYDKFILRRTLLD